MCYKNDFVVTCSKTSDAVINQQLFVYQQLFITSVTNLYIFSRFLANYHIEQNFGGVKLWQIDRFMSFGGKMLTNLQ